MFTVLILAAPLLYAINVHAADPEIYTPNGIIRGFENKTWNNVEYYAFEGVPYAEPPIGRLRFKEPVPKTPWIGAWPAKKWTNCIQYYHMLINTGNNMVIGDEDCLTVNIYIPKEKSSEPLDVIVHLHGGAFMFGAGGFNGPNILMDRTVILVTINYRLGPLGFLSTEDEALPGNLGMKDQVLALKWIKKNIKYFGGNPKSVTLTGLSAGGASVHLHLLSPMSKGLFTKAVSESGHALDCWVLAEASADKAKFIGETLGCPTNSSKIMIECLRMRPAEQIVNTVGLLQTWLYNPFSPLGVVIDKSSTTPFLPDHPYTLLEKGKMNDIPWIVSHVSEEGLYPGSDFVQNDKFLPELEQHWNEYLPSILHYDYTIDPKVKDQVSQKIKKHYLGDRPSSIETYPEIIQLIGDRLFVTDSETVAKMHAAASKSPVYYYLFKYRGTRSMSEMFTRNTNNYGVCHGDDMMTILSTKIPSYTTEKDRKMSKYMVDMWTSFAKKGVPIISDIKWIPISKNRKDPLNYLQISSPDDIRMVTEEHFKEHLFWESLPFQELGKLLHPNNISVPSTY